MDILFLLKPNFTDVLRDQQDILYYCPDCALIEGVLSYYPELRQKLDIRYIDFPTPRKEIVELVGDKHQGCPNLILDTSNNKLASAAEFYQFNGLLYSSNNKKILDYLSERYGASVAHF